jgi:hypothetical protein
MRISSSGGMPALRATPDRMVGLVVGVGYWPRFRDQLYAPHEMRPVFGRERRQQGSLQLRRAGNDLQQYGLADRRQLHLGRAAISAC